MIDKIKQHLAVHVGVIEGFTYAQSSFVLNWLSRVLVCKVEIVDRRIDCLMIYCSIHRRPVPIKCTD